MIEEAILIIALIVFIPLIIAIIGLVAYVFIALISEGFYCWLQLNIKAVKLIWRLFTENDEDKDIQR